MSEAKAGQRAAARAALSAWSPEDRAAASARLCGWIAAQPWGGDGPGPRIAAFVALRDEPDLGPRLAAWAAAGRLVLPRVEGGSLVWHAVPALAALRVGRWGLAEPAPDAPVASLADVDVALVPGVAFDDRGGRLGRGGGYYDRALAASPGVETLGVAFAPQRVDAVATDPWDRALRAVAFASPEGVRVAP